MIDMNKEKIVKILNEYNLDKQEYIVISGAAMVLLGIKESTKDIDIGVTKDYYDYLLSHYNCVFDIYNVFNNACYMIDDTINFGIDYYTNDNVLIDGIPVQTIDDIINLKKSLNRKKDIEDIKKIKNYLKEKNEK